MVYGADVSVKNKNGCTALSVAWPESIPRSFLRIIRELFARGVGIDDEN